MENENLNEINFSDKIKNLFNKNKKILIFFLSIIIFLIIGFAGLNYYKDKQNKKFSEKYIVASIYLSSNDKLTSKNIYKEIILGKNKFYSPLALNKIIENNLIDNVDEIIKLFNVVEKIKLDSNQKDLIKLKKALFLLKFSKVEEGKKILNEIIVSDSIWKNIAIDLVK
tara:strand:- start:200 stop:706 length:507 start_codon:yes stop_codon:yes gene_type:complete